MWKVTGNVTLFVVCWSWGPLGHGIFKSLLSNIAYLFGILSRMPFLLCSVLLNFLFCGQVLHISLVN